MKKITMYDFERNRIRKSKGWLAWLSLCMMVILGSNTLSYGQGETCISPITITSLPYTNSGNTSTYGNNYTSSNVPAIATGAVINGTGSTSYLNGF
jgi:hypothetical protein